MNLLDAMLIFLVVYWPIIVLIVAAGIWVFVQRFNKPERKYSVLVFPITLTVLLLFYFFQSLDEGKIILVSIALSALILAVISTSLGKPNQLNLLVFVINLAFLATLYFHLLASGW